MAWTDERRARQMATIAAKKGDDVATDDMTVEDRAQRAIRRRAGNDGRALRPIEQIRPYNQDGVPDDSAAAYYLRPDGATIGDVLIYYPNGAKHTRQVDPKGHYSQDADYHQMRMRNKGFEYVGPTLTRDGAIRMVQIILGNRDDEIERLEDEIALCEYTIKNTDRPDVRDQQRRRRDQYALRLERVRMEIDPDALVGELSEIARAQRMARIAPEVIAVMNEMLEDRIGTTTRTFEEALAKFSPPAREGDASSRQAAVATLD